jgi:hypothetical protein
MGGDVMDFFDLNKQLDELPKKYSDIAYSAEAFRELYDTAELELESKIAKKSLELAVQLKDEPSTGKEKKIKYLVDDDIDIFNLKLNVIKAKADWKQKEILSEGISKQIITLCKQADIFMQEQRINGAINKTNEPNKKAF